MEEEDTTGFINKSEEYFNYMYFISTRVLHMSHNEFMDSTPRQIKGLEIYHRMYNKRLKAEEFLMFNKPKNGKKNNTKTQKTVVAGSVSDLFGLARG